MIVRNVLRALCALALVLTSGLTAAAQIQTGEITGKVTDSTGAVLPGVTVTLTGPALLQPQVQVTTETGAYQFATLPVGTYTVAFELSGFTRVLRTGVEVRTAFVADINVTLAVSSVEETVTVSGASPVVDTRSTTVQSSFDKQFLDAIPSGRDPWVILEMTPGMVMDRQNVGGSESGQQSSYLAHGSDLNQSWNMDGATITDMAASSSPGYYDFDTFEEIQITTGGNDASLDGGGVAINMVTKSGSNVVRGTGRVMLVDEALQGDNLSDDLKRRGAAGGNPIQNIKDYGFEIGGPAIKDKLWWWGAYGRQDVRVGVNGFWRDTPECPPDVLTADTGTVRGCMETDLTELANINLKATYQPVSSHRFNYLANNSDKLRNARGASNLTGFDATLVQSSPGWLHKFDHQWIATDRLVFDTKFTYNDSGFVLDWQRPELADVQRSLDISTGFSDRSQNRSDNIRPTTEAKTDASYFLSNVLGGDHSLKGGVRWRSTPYETITTIGGGAVARFRNGVPAEADIIRDGDTNRDMWQFSAYINDSYRRGRLTANVGVRWDYQDDEALAANVEANRILPDLLPALDFAGADSGVTYSDISPRLGLTFDLTGTGKTVAKMNLARYYGIGIYTADDIAPTGATTLRYPWSDTNGDGFVQRDELDLTRLLARSANYDAANPSNPQGSQTVDPEITNDITDEFSVGLEHELVPNLGVGLTYIRRSYYNGLWEQTLGLSTDDYVPVDFTAACGNDTCPEAMYSGTYYQLRPGLTLPSEVELRNTSFERKYQGLEFVARKRFSNRWMGQGSFTWNDTRGYDHANTSYLDPTNVAFENGRQVGTLNVRWVAKLTGMVQLPWGFNTSAFLNMRQGAPLNRVIQSPTRAGAIGRVDVLVEPTHSTRYDDMYILDWRLERWFTLGNRYRVAASLDVFNALNNGLVLDQVERQNAANANEIETVLAPRVARIGVRIQF